MEAPSLPRWRRHKANTMNEGASECEKEKEKFIHIPWKSVCSAASERAKERAKSGRAPPDRSALLCSLSLSLLLPLPPSASLFLMSIVSIEMAREETMSMRESFITWVQFREGQKITSDSANPGPQLPGAHGRWASATGRKYMPASMRLAPPHMHPGRGHSVPTVTELIFVGAQRFTNRAI